MKQRLFSALLSLSLLCVLAASCAGQGPQTNTPQASVTQPPPATESEPTPDPATQPAAGDATVEDYAQLVAALEAAGATVEAAGEVQQPFFGPPGQIIKVNGGDVQVFEYPEAEVVAHDANQVAADGSSIGTQAMMWMATPHFFKSGKLIVLYLGDDASVMSFLIGALGPQFAGR